MAVARSGMAASDVLHGRDDTPGGGGSVPGRADQATVMVLVVCLTFFGAYRIMVPAGAFSGGAEPDAAAVNEPAAPRIVQVERAVMNPVPYLVDINQAGVNDLILLPGVGEKTAEKIISERTQNGAYRSVDDLTRVRGIGAKKVEALRMHVLPISETEQQMAAAVREGKKAGGAEM